METENYNSESETWLLRLYVAGVTTKSKRTFVNLKEICEQHLQGMYQIEVIDLYENPQIAQTEQILALPTVVRNLPKPVRKIIGDLSDREKVLIALDLRPVVTEKINYEST